MMFNVSQILDALKMNEFAEDSFDFDENGRKFTIRVENTVGKREIALYKPESKESTCPFVFTRKNLVRASELSFFVQL